MSATNYEDTPTVGVDWEVWITRPNGRLVPERPELAAMVERLRDRAPEMPIGLDFQQIELRSGVCESAAALRERIRRAYALTRSDARRRGRRVFPGASHPSVANFCGGHVHVGPFFDCREAEETKLAMLAWIPGLVALSAASPDRVDGGDRYRSYRVATSAGGCLRPLATQAPGSSFPVWGEDLCVKALYKPTIEVRLLDGAVDAEVYGELATLAAGLVLSVRDGLRGGDIPRVQPVAAAHREALRNRYNAFRFGLQATFVQGGRAVTAGRFVTELLEAARPGLARLGTAPEALATLAAMARLQVTQADWIREAGEGASGSARAVQLLSVRDAEPFAAWLARQSAPRVAVPFEDPIEALPAICRGLRPWADVVSETSLPPAVVLEALEDLASRGRVRLIKDRMRGLLVEELRAAVDPPVPAGPPRSAERRGRGGVRRQPFARSRERVGATNTNEDPIGRLRSVRQEGGAS